LILKAIEARWRVDHDPRLLEFIRTYIDAFIGPDGAIATYRGDEYNLDQVNPGKNLFFLWETTGEPRYRVAIETLRDQLRNHPRTESRGFWHKKIYPYQMWLDGLYMQGPFYAEYVSRLGPPEDWADIVYQFVLVEARARDTATGLLYHAWDESHEMPWSHPETGCSPHFWGRAMGWYGMALVDLLDWMPTKLRERSTILAILGRYVEAAARYQDPASGLWYQVLDQGTRAGNYLESSASATFSYTLAKAASRCWIDAQYAAVGRRAFEGLVAHKLKTDARGLPSLVDVCAVAGLGGHPYRDGSFEYYVGERRAADDYKGLGPFILAALEQEAGAEAARG